MLQEIGRQSTEQLEKNIILHYLEPVGGRFNLCCHFDSKKLPIKLPAFYEEYLKCFVKCSAANRISLQDQNEQDLSKAIVWNKKIICIGVRAIFLPRGGGEPFAQKFSQVAKCLTKQSKRNEGHKM